MLNTSLMFSLVLLYFCECSLRWVVHLHINFEPIPLCGFWPFVWENSWLFIPENLLCSFYQVRFSFISLSLLLKVVAYPVSRSTDWFCFVRTINCNFEDLLQILIKICANNCLWMPYKCTNFHPDWIIRSWIIVIFCFCAKNHLSLLTHILSTAYVSFLRSGMWPPLISTAHLVSIG